MMMREYDAFCEGKVAFSAPSKIIELGEIVTRAVETTTSLTGLVPTTTTRDSETTGASSKIDEEMGTMADSTTTTGMT